MRRRMTDEELANLVRSYEAEEEPSRRTSARPAPVRPAPEMPAPLPAGPTGWDKTKRFFKNVLGVGIIAWAVNHFSQDGRLLSHKSAHEGESNTKIVYVNAGQPKGLQSVLQQNQRPPMGQVVQASYEDAIMDNLANGDPGAAVEAAQTYGALKTAVEGHRRRLPEKQVDIMSERMDTEIAWEDADQAEAKAHEAHSDNKTLEEKTAKRVRIGRNTVHEGRGLVREVHGALEDIRHFWRE